MEILSHTPGPWKIIHDRNHPALIKHVLFEGTDEHTPCMVARCESEDGYAAAQRMNEANARLIAAAPDLLAALLGIAAIYDTHSHEDMQAVASDMVREARAAIAKAQGRS